MRTCCVAQGTVLHFAVQQKVTQHCKTTIPQFKKKKKKNGVKTNVRADTIKLLEEQIGSTSLILVLATFFGCVSSVKGNKTNNKQMGQHQSKNIFTAKETISKMKRQTIEWRKIFANNISNSS